MSLIFVVEDDTTLRNVLMEKLSKSGYTVEGAEDGEMALQKLRGGLKPDLMLLDILMPKKNGMEVMEEMSKDPVLKNIPIFIVSNSGQPVEIERAKELGAKDFLIKADFSPTEVLEKIEAILQSHRNDHSEGKQGVLVVEDDQFLRELFVRKLASSGFKVENAVDAKGAFAILEKWKPNIILLDLMLPDVDGFEILSRLKKDERFAPIPVIIVSNLGEQHDIDRAMELGAQEFLVKVNFNLEEIAEHVREVLKNVKK
ncbi:MAG: response regulator [Patescibacteria group bacterium]|nr:response regulator [Patescibacteria group bacterium]